MIKDSGTRTSFESGAVRDIQKGKGRCDLMPLDVVAAMTEDVTFLDIYYFLDTGRTDVMLKLISNSAVKLFGSIENALLEVSIHYEEGAEKYGEHNWEKGIPAHSFVDSAIRHYIKLRRGDKDERHDRAFIWNLLGLLWTIEHHSELNDLPYCTRDADTIK
jgi:hypothetical protein